MPAKRVRHTVQFCNHGNGKRAELCRQCQPENFCWIEEHQSRVKGVRKQACKKCKGNMTCIDDQHAHFRTAPGVFLFKHDCGGCETQKTKMAPKATAKNATIVPFTHAEKQQHCKIATHARFRTAANIFLFKHKCSGCQSKKKSNSTAILPIQKNGVGSRRAKRFRLSEMGGSEVESDSGTPASDFEHESPTDKLEIIEATPTAAELINVTVIPSVLIDAMMTQISVEEHSPQEKDSEATLIILSEDEDEDEDEKGLINLLQEDEDMAEAVDPETIAVLEEDHEASTTIIIVDDEDNSRAISTPPKTPRRGERQRAKRVTAEQMVDDEEEDGSGMECYDEEASVHCLHARFAMPGAAPALTRARGSPVTRAAAAAERKSAGRAVTAAQSDEDFALSFLNLPSDSQ